ncbi:MAG: rhomboid family intramembrane serine protease [Spirochaetales bacterium]|nr:rhomboid family intramembrane serine protease [Spirochaetales bacterium]
MKISYNAPVTLTFALFSALILLLDTLLKTNLIESFFSTPPHGVFSFSHVQDYFRLFTHIFGHANWMHLLGNFSFILLLGPQLEEKYGSGRLIFMILITAGVTGLLHSLFVGQALLVGASGIVFMMILLSSFTRVKNGYVPLTFILIVILYLLKEFISALKDNNISELAHIAGGISGSVFGFIRSAKTEKAAMEELPENPEEDLPE